MKARVPLKAKTTLKAKTGLKSNPKPKKQKKPTITKLKKEADKWHSLATRLRFADLKNGEWWVKCFTCPNYKPIGQMQCGHFQSRMHNATRYEEENTAPQCLTAESKLKMFNGTYKSIAKVKIGDELWTFNEDNYGLERAVVVQAQSFMPQILYEVELENGEKFYATADHKVVANGEWVCIRDMLHNVSTYDILEI